MTLQDKVSHGAAVAKWKLDQQKRLMSIQADINELQGLIRNRKVRLSDTALALFAQDQLVETDLIEICTEIDGMNSQIKIKESEKEFVKNERPPELNIQTPIMPSPTGLVCPECGKPLVGRYCAEHGVPGVQARNVEAADSEDETKEQQLFCPVCGKPVPFRFCPDDGAEGVPK